ncbi:hypothetical protein B1J93_14910 [Leptospira kirschneri serovar Pomona]|uniref:Uncharacterized protein n=1 Tax=Leptospira kirschneri serovar Pomona TaxID=561005 RepID=A0A1T1DJA7_9LEPT|nr:hypothetical protein LEP1GSC198_2611 [Leptospira kirschneri str. JB]EMK05134.1 hypothetical protein LEP1GSC166_0786 [Leptospira kirschneri]KXZ33798.1 hypothetical protein AYB34_10230 [Leptospira sp. ZV016]OOV40965.1 hypothetical protein B1J93_14910 [Leptospira kirschneri serovar Pomona]
MKQIILLFISLSLNCSIKDNVASCAIVRGDAVNVRNDKNQKRLKDLEKRSKNIEIEYNQF